MRKIMAVVAGVLMSALAVLGTAVPAGAAPVAKGGQSICDTSGPHNAEYRRKCMRAGTIGDAAHMWYSVDKGTKGREKAGAFNRRSICKFAGRFGGIRPAVNEQFFDVAYDTFTNRTSVLGWTVTIAKTDCRAMGYKV